MSAAADLLGHVNAALVELGYNPNLIASCTVRAEGLDVESVVIGPAGKAMRSAITSSLITEHTFHPFAITHGTPD